MPAAALSHPGEEADLIESVGGATSVANRQHVPPCLLPRMSFQSRHP
jgi:hypothetical protein